MATTSLRRAQRVLIGVSLALPSVARLAAVAHAQAPTLAQLAHRAWTARDGAPAGVTSIAQTADGFLWLGTSTGLYRFDGVRFERYEPPAGQTMPSGNVSALLVTPGDSLWIGYRFGGASVLAGGRLRHDGPTPDGLPPATVRQFARDSSGGIWAATQAGLVSRVGGRWRKVGAERGLPGGMTTAVLFDRRGTMWVAQDPGVFARARGEHQFVRRAPPLGAVSKPGMQEGPDGSVWGASDGRGLVQLAGAAGGPPQRGDRASGDSSQALLFDADGNAWLPGKPGVAWIPRPAALGAGPAGAPAGGAAAGAGRQTRSPAQGMSGSLGWTVFRDHEGSIWVGTTGGLDQFRPTKLTPTLFSHTVTYPAIAAGDSGTLWMESQNEPLLELGARTIVRGRIADGATCAYRDLEGGVWLGGGHGTLWQLRGGTRVPIAVPAAATANDVQAIARDRNGGLWLSVLDSGVFRRRGAVWERFQVPPRVTGPAMTIVADRAGRTWLGYPRDRLVRVDGDSVRLYGAAQALHVGNLAALHVHADRVWVGGEFGVMLLDGADPAGRFRPLATTDGPIRSVSGIVETAAGELWLNGGQGVTRVPAPELRRALGDPAYLVRAERFDYRDGIEGTPAQVRPLPTAVEGSDGRLWFTTTASLASVDPVRIPRNAVAPAVRIRFLEAEGRRDPAAGDGVALPKRTTALQIAYTATSLAIPERVRFRYRLVGLDTAWQDAGARREAFYTNLAPRAYRFEVSAANDDGVWSVAPAALDVVIPPAFVQTNAFLALCVAAAGGAVWALALWRQRRAVAAVRARAEVTFAERMRVARELHDTLLTDVAGLRMQLDAATRVASPAGVAVSLVATLRDQASQTLANARRAVVDMRASGDAAGPVADQLVEVARRVFSDTPVSAHVAHTGTPRRYPWAVEGEALRIAGEALANVRAHAACRTVRVTCAYGRRALRVEVRDDGQGFDAARAAPYGHFGLAGMRERAGALGAQLTVDSAPGRGTAVLLIIPVEHAH